MWEATRIAVPAGAAMRHWGEAEDTYRSFDGHDDVGCYFRHHHLHQHWNGCRFSGPLGAGMVCCVVHCCADGHLAHTDCARMGRAPDDTEIRAELMAVAVTRGASKSFCPPDVARRFGPHWRLLMPEIRRVAAVVQAEGVLIVAQKGRSVKIRHARGPIRPALSSGQTAPRR